MLELAKYYGQGPVRISVIAEKQIIPQKFLENILNELKSTGLIESRRGARGGYLLTKEPDKIAVGDIIRLVDGPLDPVKCVGEHNASGCPLHGSCSLEKLWCQAKTAVEDVYDNTTFKDLVEQEKELNTNGALSYCI
jgi:Rrf2 family transcriptional regulator, cysteine metabolism repressor